MAKYVNDAVMDAAFAVIKSAASAFMTVCSSQPTTRSQAMNLAASSGFRLTAPHAMTSADYVIADSASSGGRKVTVGAQNSLSVAASGSAAHVAIYDAAKLILVTTCTSQALTTGNKVNVPAFKDAIGDAA